MASTGNAAQRAGTPRSRRPVAAGLAIVVAGALALAAALSLPDARAEVVGGNAPVNAGALDRLDISGHNSPAVVANPRDPANLVVANRIDTPRFSCAVHASFDGGVTWQQAEVPPLPHAIVGCFSPDVAFGADGVLYLSFSSFADVRGSGTIPDAVWLATSRDGGKTLSAPTKALGPSAFQVRLLADPAVPGRLYLTWVQGGTTSGWGFADVGNPILVARSEDAGATWQAPRRVSPTARVRVIAPVLASGGAGEVLYSAYLDVGEDRLSYHGAHEGRGGDPYPGTWSLVVARSRDGGRSWREHTAEPAIVPTQRFLILFPPTPSLAVDQRRGRVYVAFTHGNGRDADVWVWSSADGGATWRAVRLGGEWRGPDRSQYLPAVAVAPSGRVDVAYYDRRRDADDVLNDVSLQSSFDGGSNFTSPLRVSERPFDSTIGFGRERGMAELGNRLGLLATDRGDLVVWADTRGGARPTDKQDLARAFVSVAGPHPLRTPLWRGGIAGVLAGGLVLLVWLVPRLRSSRRGRQDASAVADRRA